MASLPRARGARFVVASAWIVVGALALPAAPARAAPKTDVVVLVNGDRITGEIKTLEHNRLRLSTDHMGTVHIEWDKVVRLESEQYLLLERSDGVRHYGQLVAGGGEAELRVRRNRQSPAEPVPMTSIVRAQPIVGGRFVDRLDGYLSAGLNTAKANDRRSFDVAAGLSSRTRQREWSVDGSANLTDDESDATSERYDLAGTWRRFRPERYFWQGFAGLERNTELDLNLRTLAGLGLGRYVRQTRSGDWIVGLGVAYSHENYAGSTTFDSLEAVLTTSFSIFRYDFPETDVGGSLTVLPSLTESGRYRAEADLRARYEFVDDVYFELKLYGSYDSEPPREDAQTSDYGFVTSLGYSF